MSTGNPPAPYRLTYADWLRLPDDGRLYEIIDGELFMASAPRLRHQRISRKLGTRLGLWLEATGRGELFFAPTTVRLTEGNIIQPDLVVVLAEHQERLGEQVIEGPPDLVVEILSLSSARRDRVTKREIYARFQVREYWIVDSEAAQVEVLTLERGAYTRSGLYPRGETLQSALFPDLAISLYEVFAEGA